MSVLVNIFQNLLETQGSLNRILSRYANLAVVGCAQSGQYGRQFD